MMRFGVATIGRMLTVVVTSPVAAQTVDQSSALQLVAESRSYSDDLGSLKTVRLDYELDDDNLTLVISPAFGNRQSGDVDVSAVGLGGTLYLKLAKGLTTRTQVFLAEEKPVLVNRDLAQDVSFNIGRRTVTTLGLRWATYFGNQELVYLNGGVRHYFKGGSVAYRYSRIDPDSGKAFSSHLVNLSLNDSNGPGKSQLWVAYGQTNPEIFDPALSFSGKDYGVSVRRVQPVGGGLSLVGLAGYASYDRPAGRVSATTFGLGIRFALD